MDRKCSKCLRTLDESEFNWKYKGIKLQYHCKECSRRYIRTHYQNNHSYYIKKAHKRNKRIKEEMIIFIGKYLSTHKCVDCGEKDVLVLEFDHRVRSQKINDVSILVRGRGSLQKVIDEIKKCDVRCANCHRRKTASETNSWRLKFALVAQRIE